MPLEGVGPFWISNAAGQGSNGQLASADPGTGNQGNCNFGTSTTQRWIQLKYVGSNSTTASNLNSTDGGWNFTAADFDATVGTPCDRLLVAGTAGINGNINVATADIGGTFDVHGKLSIRSATGVFTEIAGGTDSGVSASLPGVIAFAFSINVPRTVIPAGSTLHLTLWIFGRGVVILGQTLTMRRGHEGAPVTDNKNAIDLAAPGLRFQFIRALTGGVTPAGSLSPTVVKYFTGTVTPSGTVTKLVSKFFVGGTTPSGVLVKTPIKYFTGGITPTGDLVKTPIKSLAGTISSAGSLIRTPKKLLLANITPSGTVTKQVFRFLVGGVTPTGVNRNTIVKHFTGFFYGPAGSGGAQIIRKIFVNVFED
jgi:hypothetical protein